MASYVVLQPSDRLGPDAIERARFVRDGFSFPAFLVPLLWMLWHRLWIEAVAVLAVMLGLTALGEWAGMGIAASAASLLFSVGIGLEASAIRVAALRRRGWIEWGVIDAHDLQDAEIRYAAAIADGIGPAPTEPPAPAIMPVSAPAPALPARKGGPALGLLSYPARS
jgi:hypothetical protein